MVEYDKRKIIKVGEKSYAVTLPKKWCSELGLQPGDIVDLIFHETSIVLKLKSRKPAENAQIFLDASKGEERLIRQLIACYIEGATRIKIKGDPREVSRLLQQLMKKLMGLVAMGDLKSPYTDVVILESHINLKDITKRITSITTEIFDTIFSYLESGDKKLLNEALRYCDEVSQLYFLGLKTTKGELLKADSEDVLSMVDLAMFLRDVEHMTGSLIRLIKALERMDHEGLEVTREVFILVRKMALDALQAFTGDKIEMALSLLSSKDKLKEMLERNHEVLDRLVLNEFNLIMNLSSSIAEIVLGKCVRNKMCRCKYFYPKL